MNGMRGGREIDAMRAARSFVVAILASVVAAAPAVVLAAGPVARVVGNSACTHVGRLPNPGNDVPGT